MLSTDELKVELLHLAAAALLFAMQKELHKCVRASTRTYLFIFTRLPILM